MTTIQKSIIVAALASVAGTGIYAARQNAQLRGQIETLQRQQAPLMAQIEELEQERNDATNQLTGLLARNAQFQSDSNELELLSLRGKVGVLQLQADEAKQQLATAVSAKAQFTSQETGKVDDAKQLETAMCIYAYGNGGKSPTNFVQLTNLLPSWALNDIHSFDYVNAVTADTQTHPNPRIINIRERLASQAPDGTWQRIYGFADGRVVTATSYDGNFDTWEKANTDLPTPAQ